ncbi:MAG: lipopolysaccharide biosynthesis protein [Candidatus Methanomethyliaceae archaeon]
MNSSVAASYGQKVASALELDVWHRARLLGAVGWAGATRAVSEGVRFLRTLVLARLLAPEDFGVFGIAMLVLGVLEAFTEPGWKTALVQRREGVARYLDSVFVASAVRGLLLGVGVWIVAPTAARFWNVPALAPMLAAVAVVILLRGVTNPAVVLLERDLDFRRIFVWSSIESATSLAVGVVLAWRGFGAWSLVGSLIAGEGARTGLSYWLKPWRPRLLVDWNALRELTRFSRWVMASNAVVFVGLQLDSALVAKLISPTAFGFYLVAHRLASLARATVVSVLSQVAYPALCVAQNDIKKRRRILAHFWMLSATAAGVFALLLVLGGGPAVAVALGPRWAPAVSLVRVLALAHWLRCIAVIPSCYLLAAGRPQLDFLMAAVRAGVLGVLLWPLVRAWGAVGAAWACVAGAGAMSLVWATVLCSENRRNPAFTQTLRWAMDRFGAFRTS